MTDNSIHPEDQGVTGIDPRNSEKAAAWTPYNWESFEQLGVLDAWGKYRNELTWGKGQCLAILDDGCDISIPEWRVELPWGKKVVATWNAVDNNEDPSHVPPGYHGTTVGFPSSLNHDGVYGVAFNNHVAHVRCVSVVHLRQDESETMASALQWVLDNRENHNITAVNLAPLDDQAHQHPIPTGIDPLLRDLRNQNIWVSAPCGNHGFDNGISWPACQPHCYAIGATQPGKHAAHLDRYRNTDLLVCAQATSSSNAYAAASFIVLREAIEKCGFCWQTYGETLPDAALAIFRETGHLIQDEATSCEFRELNLRHALDRVFQ